MTMFLRLAVAFAAAICIPGAIAPAAAAPVHYTSAWFLGDSLSDPGNLFAATGGLIPPAPYWNGRVSNGPVWAEYIAEDFAAKGLPTGNFAYAYATAVHVPPPLPPAPPYRPVEVPDLPQQIAMFQAQSAGLLGGQPLVSLFFGANDIFGALKAAAAGAPNPSDIVKTAAEDAAKAVVDGIKTLTGPDVKHFMVFTLAPLDKTPAFAGTPLQDLAALGTGVFDATLLTELGKLDGGQRVSLVNMSALFDLLIADPSAYDIDDVDNPCFIPDPYPGFFFPGCSLQVADTWAFFDPVHPNGVVHKALANEVRKLVAPVPLPLPGLLLAGGVVMLVAVRRRARG